MAINLAQKYSAKLDQIFTHGSYTDAFVNKNYDFDGVATVNVYTVTTVATSAYDRTDTGDRFGGNNEIQDTVATYTLENDKCFKLVIDRGNYDQQALAKKAGEVLKAEMNEQVIPEIDKDRIATAVAAATAATHEITATTDSYADFLGMAEYLDEEQAPMAGRVCFVTPKFYNAIKKDITSTVNAPEYNDKLLARGFVGELDGCPIIKVPSSLFPSGKQAVMYHKDALLGANQRKKTWIKTDSELVDGSILMGRFIYDTFALEAKKGAFASVSGTVTI